MPSITSIFDAKLAKNIALKTTSAPDPIKMLVYGNRAEPVNSFVLPARYWTKTLKATPMVYGSLNAEPMQKTALSNINYDIGSFWAKTQFDAEEMAEWMQMSGQDAVVELERLITNDGMVAKDFYVANMLATSMTGTLAVKTRVNANGGFDTFNINYGTVSTTARTGASWATAAKSVMYQDLKKNHKAIETQIGKRVSKQSIYHFASEEAFVDLMEIIENTQNIDNIKVDVGDVDGYDYISLNGYKVFDIKGDYVDAETQGSAQAVAANYIQAVYVDPSAGHGLYYLKIKNKRVNFQPLPIGIIPVEYQDGTGFEVNFASRPIPIFNYNASTKMLVIS